MSEGVECEFETKQEGFCILGVMERDCGDLYNANRRFQQALENYHEHYGKDADNSNIAACLDQLGIVSQLKGSREDLDYAERCYHKRLEMEKRLNVNGVDHPNMQTLSIIWVFWHRRKDLCQIQRAGVLRA